jgi:uncharacterized membrane protein
MRTFNLKWFILALLSISIGLYPLIYTLDLPRFGLLSTKPAALLANGLWQWMFYLHIGFGGLSLLVGWTQFVPRWQRERLPMHRLLGKVYIGSVLLSGVSGFYVGTLATGGRIAQAGFILLALLWLGTTLRAYLAVRSGNIYLHKRMMVYSFAAAFAAVTLRIWLPLLVILHQGHFLPAYRIVAWLAWVPNILVAYWINRRSTQRLKAA